MILALILIGVILMVTAYAGTYAQLATELESDIPGYFKWGLALAAIVAFGYIPGMKTPSRWLLAIVLLVLFLTNFTKVQSQLQNFWQQGGTPSNTANTANAVVQQAATTAATATGTGAAGLPVTSSLLGG